jgi:glycosyltransferase involved in cell wall biosynthesis
VPKPRVLYDRFRVLFIGGCLFRKGLLRLLAALRKADLPHCELALVTSSIRGGTAYDYDGRPLAGRAATIVREAFRDLAITLVPPALGPSELTVLYQRSHVYVCPSVSDNGPNTLVESTWLGTPSVASDMSGALEAVPRDFRRTWVAPKWWRGEDGADCEEKLASEITRCYEELFLRRRLWDYGTAMQRDFFRSAWLERLFDEYRRVLRPAASGEVSPP